MTQSLLWSSTVPIAPSDAPGTCAPRPSSIGPGCSSWLLLGFGFASFLPFFERGAKAVEARLPQAAVLPEPTVELPKTFWFERIETSLRSRPHRNEAGLQEDAQMTGNAGLVDA